MCLILGSPPGRRRGGPAPLLANLEVFADGPLVGFQTPGRSHHTLGTGRKRLWRRRISIRGFSDHPEVLGVTSGGT